MSKFPQQIKLAFILFVKLNQANWLLYFFNNQIYKEIGTFPLKINLIFFISHLIAIYKIFRNLKKIEVLFVTILSLLQIEDLYFLLRFDKFKKYYSQDDNKGWLMRYIFALSIITFQILIQQINIYTSCSYLVLPRISLVFLCYIYQYYLFFGESQLCKILEKIKIKNLILSSFQMFCFFYLGLPSLIGDIQNVIFQNISDMFLFLQMLIIFLLIKTINFQNLLETDGNKQRMDCLMILYLLKFISGISVILEKDDKKNKKIDKISACIMLFDKYLIYIQAIYQIINLVSYFIYIQTDYENKVQKYDVVKVTLKLILISTYFQLILKKSYLRKNKVLIIDNINQLQKKIIEFNNKKLEGISVILLKIKTDNQSKNVITNCLLCEFEGCQIIDIFNCFERTNLKNSDFQEVVFNKSSYQLHQMQLQMLNKNIIKQISQVSAKYIQPESFLKLISLINQQGLVIRINQEFKYDRYLKPQLVRVNEVYKEYCQIYFNIFNYYLAFNKNITSYLTLNHHQVFYDLFDW